MKKALTINRNFINFGLPICIFGLLVFLMQSQSFVKNDTLSFAITLDLLITVPFIYFLLIRKTDIPKTTVVPIMIIGLILGSYFLPREHQSYLTLFKNYALPVIELSILVFVIFKVRRVLKTYKTMKGTSPDFFNVLKSTCTEILPKKLVMPFATEVAVFYYGFVNWKTTKLDENEFSYHKKSGTPSLFGAFIMIIGVETVALHIFLARWSVVAAWVLSALSVYTAIQLIGFTKSLSRRPISISSDSLYLKYGIMNEVEIPLSNIDSIELSKKSIPQDSPIRKLSPFGDLESHNVLIHLKDENEMIGFYGIRKKFKVLAFYVDDAKGFVRNINEVLVNDGV